MHWLEKNLEEVIGDWLGMEGEEDWGVWDDIQVSELGNQVDDGGSVWGKSVQEEEGIWEWEMLWEGDDDSVLDMLILRCSLSIERNIY